MHSGVDGSSDSGDLFINKIILNSEYRNHKMITTNTKP